MPIKNKRHPDNRFAGGQAPWVKWQRSKAAVTRPPVHAIAKRA